jgi:CRISPR-associated endonuclease/helicase Cas3
LSKKRIEQFEAIGFQRYPKTEDYRELSDLVEQEAYPRYRRLQISSQRDAFNHAIAAYNSDKHGRILWVVNVVDRCQELAQLFKEQNVLCYHSRFTLENRRQIHEATVKAFQQRDRPAIAVTTQVCEMSLDLDADVLITEVAPPSSLVQRFGRANRKLDDKRADFRAELLTYPTDYPAPYTTEEIRAGNAFLTELGFGEMSQQKLANLLERHAPEEPLAGKLSRFLDSGYYAIPGKFRDGEEFTRPCILDRDLEKAQHRLSEKEQYDAYVINVPEKSKRWRKASKEESWLPKYLGIAQSEFYSERYGFFKERRGQIDGR